MRATYIVSYDISDAKRWRKVFKICKNYGAHLQLSVFECDLTEQELEQMSGQLGEVVHHEKDQVLFIRLGLAEARGDRQIRSLGVAYHHFDAPCFVL